MHESKQYIFDYEFNPETIEALGQQYSILRYFKYDHLPAELQNISSPFWHLAHVVAYVCPYNAETSTALRKLLEAKDAAVRAALD
jgi:hypothetical protein